jgi:phosphoribosylamine--glycine ligase
MINEQGQAKVVEFNCRFGDPETQPVMLRLQSDLVALVQAALAGELDKTEADWDARPSIGVVMAAGGYPASYAKGDAISGLNDVADDVKVFHAGTKEQDGAVVTNGGRVLCVTALGDSVAAAQAYCYENLKKIDWDKVYYRTDIAYRAVEREQQG